MLMRGERLVVVIDKKSSAVRVLFDNGNGELEISDAIYKRTSTHTGKITSVMLCKDCVIILYAKNPIEEVYL